MGIVVLFAFSDLGRRMGQGVQARLHSGEMPEQWYRGNPDIAEAAKDRYRAFMALQIGSAAPSINEEGTNPHKSNEFYSSAGNWLREHTRDTKKFAILFNENITYGFRRNLLGLKPVALASNVVVLALCGAVLCFPQSYFEELPNLKEKIVVTMTAAILHSIFMIAAVREASVFEASRTYGRQLILSCETLMKAKTSASKKTGISNARC